MTPPIRLTITSNAACSALLRRAPPASSHLRSAIFCRSNRSRPIATPATQSRSNKRAIICTISTFATPACWTLSVPPISAICIDECHGFLVGVRIWMGFTALGSGYRRAPAHDPALAGRSLLSNRRRILAIASYEVVGSGGAWHVKHDGEPIGNYPSKEVAFEAAVAAALPVVREGYEVEISVPGRRIEP